MEEFRNTYLQLCKAHNVDAQDCVLDAMTRSSAVNQNSGIILDLSTNGLTAATCQILGKVLSSSRNIQGLHLNDCMLPEPGVVAIARGLMSTASLTTLSLKGNNIRGAGAVSLAGLLRTNKHLKTLLLEWNVLGILDNSFATFAESLGVNATLERLDLRSNQLSHDCAAELASALRRNTSLLTLDLRWNNVGITGGRALLVAMETNKTLTRMDVAGNGVPADVVAALQTLVAANADRRALVDEHRARVRTLAGEMRHLEATSERRLSEALDRADAHQVALDETAHDASLRISHLQVALDERRSIVGSLTTQLRATETSLVAAETTAGDLSTKLRKREEEAVAAATQHHVEVAAAREEREKLEGDLLARVAATTERCERAERKLEETGRRCELERGQACALKEELASVQAERKLKACEMQERLQQERSRGKQTLQEQEELRQRESARASHDLEALEKACAEKVARLERCREGLEEQLSDMRSQLHLEKVSHDEQTQEVRMRVRAEESEKQHHLLERIRHLEQARVELETHAAQQMGVVDQLQTKNSAISLEKEVLTRRINMLQQELAGKDKEWQTEVGRVKLTVKEQKAMLEEHAGQLRQLEQQKSTLEKKLADQERKHREDVEEKDNAVNRLQEKLRRAEAEMGGMREEEAQRATMLQNAVLSYVTAVKSHQAK